MELELDLREVIGILVGLPCVFCKANLTQAAFRCVKPSSVMGLCDAVSDPPKLGLKMTAYEIWKKPPGQDRDSQH
jgi:hypothetical protein